MNSLCSNSMGGFIVLSVYSKWHTLVAGKQRFCQLMSEGVMNFSKAEGPSAWTNFVQLFFRYKTIPLDAWHVEITHNKITKINKSALYFCGFPTLKHIKHKVKDFSLSRFQLFNRWLCRSSSFMCCFVFTQFYLKKSGVQVFQQSSHGENMMLEIIVDGSSKDQVSIQLLTKDQNLTKKDPYSWTKEFLISLNWLNSQIWGVKVLHLCGKQSRILDIC